MSSTPLVAKWAVGLSYFRGAKSRHLFAWPDNENSYFQASHVGRKALLTVRL